MFARNVTMRLKPNSVPEFTRTFENDVLPLLRKQTGFQDELTLVIPGGAEVVGIRIREQRSCGRSRELPECKPMRFATRPSTRSLLTYPEAPAL